MTVSGNSSWRKPTNNPEGMTIELKTSPLASIVLGADSGEGLLAEDDR